MIYEVYLFKVLGQRVKVTDQRGDPQNQPKAGPEAKVKESASHHTLWHETQNPTNKKCNSAEKSAEGRARVKGKGECFAPFYIKIMVFCVKMLFFWS